MKGHIGLSAVFGARIFDFKTNRWIKKSELDPVAKLTRLQELEKVIERGKASFIEVGQALEEVRDAKLYKEKYGTFAEYCELRWGFKKSRAYQFMEGAKAALKLPEAKRPKTERAMRKVLKSQQKKSAMVDKKPETAVEDVGQNDNGELDTELRELVRRVILAGRNPGFRKALCEWLDESGL